jgi:hypothetical protein
MWAQQLTTKSRSEGLQFAAAFLSAALPQTAEARIPKLAINVRLVKYRILNQ